MAVNNLVLFSRILARRVIKPTTDNKTPQQVDPDAMEAAVTAGVVKAFSQFATKDGSALKIHQENGSTPA